MLIYILLVQFIVIISAANVFSAPIDDHTVYDQSLWDNIFLRTFFVPFNGALNKNDGHNELNAYKEDNKNVENNIKEESDTSISHIDLLTNYKNSISDFGTGYGFYPIGLAVFTNGIRTGLGNVKNNTQKS